MAVTKWEVVVLALGDAGGQDGAVDTEDVAMAAFRLAPTSFSWRKYHDQIDLDSVRVSLTDACKDKYGGLVVGSVGKGWYLSDAGADWLRTTGPPKRQELGVEVPEKRLDARMESAHLGRELARVKATRAFRQWSEDRQIDTRDAAAVFRIDRYTSRKDRTLKTRRVVEAIDHFGDPEMIAFITMAKEKADEMPDAKPLSDLVAGSETGEEI